MSLPWRGRARAFTWAVPAPLSYEGFEISAGSVRSMTLFLHFGNVVPMRFSPASPDTPNQRVDGLLVVTSNIPNTIAVWGWVGSSPTDRWRFADTAARQIDQRWHDMSDAERAAWTAFSITNPDQSRCTLPHTGA